jgi:hypothetical protein
MTRVASIVLGVALVLLGLGLAVPDARSAPSPWSRVVLVELYTSQGCSSCPPADAWVRTLPRQGLGRDKVVPLTFHVDYWDDLGWRDPFALPEFTSRQDWYLRSRRLRLPALGGHDVGGLYTPQMIVDGRVHFPGGDATTAAAEIQRAGTKPPRIDLDARSLVGADEVTVTVQAKPRPGLPHGDWRLVVALAATKTRTRVLQGENVGATLEEAAVVRALSDRVPLAFDRFKTTPATAAVTLRKPPDLTWRDVELVAFVQDEETRDVAAAIDETPAGGGTNRQ